VRAFASSRFWQRFNALPADIQLLARRYYALLPQDLAHPSLRFKPVRSGQYRSVRIGLHYHALGIPIPKSIQWFWVGTHAEYDHLLS